MKAKRQQHHYNVPALLETGRSDTSGEYANQLATFVNVLKVRLHYFKIRYFSSLWSGNFDCFILFHTFLILENKELSLFFFSGFQMTMVLTSCQTCFGLG